ncbi:phosphonoacetaldehyde methylase [Sphingomonas koreensis]|nr:phosphonoacetaldehyde methylase [Sphingomonas koreensis]TPG38290.1 phosphonoacetaldehyde methylase [Sphingomonas koreensis]
MSAVQTETLPRGALLFAGGLVMFTIAVTSFVRLDHIPPTASPVLLRAADHVAPVKSRNLRFIDRADGAVLIEDTGTGGTASVIEPGSKSGFIRGVMRGLARERRMHGFGDQAPFKLTLWKDGELSLTDTTDGRSIELGAFGSTNRAAFAVLLDAKGTKVS